MITFEKHLILSSGTGIGIATITTTSGTYVEVTNPAYVYFDSALYPDSTIYFEAVFKTGAGTAYCALWDNDLGASVAASEVTTTSTSVVSVRSAAFTPTSGHTYTVRIAVSGGNTVTYYSSRLVIVQNATTITATESQIPIIANGTTSTNASYEDVGTIYWGWFRYTSANWDGTVAVYLDVTFKTSAGTATVGLHDSSNNLVSSGEVTTTSTSFVRVRSSALTLSNATDYKVRIKTSAGTATITDARVVIQQTGNPTKSESYITLLRSTTAASATGGTFQDSLHKITYTSTNWSVDTITWNHEANGNSNTASGTFETYNITGAARTTGSNVASTNGGAIVRYRSGAVTMPTTQDITERCDSASGTIYTSIAHLIATLVWTNGSPSLSPSFSQSSSESKSSSQSASSSVSSSESKSLSPSISASASLTPAPTYSKGDETSLPTNDNDLENLYSNSEIDDVASSNNVRVAQTATNQYAIHQFKNDIGSASACNISWEGQTTWPPSSNSVVLQVYNRNTSSWETVDSDNTTAVNTDFTLSGNIPDTTNYKDGDGFISCRVYQQMTF